MQSTVSPKRTNAAVARLFVNSSGMRSRNSRYESTWDQASNSAGTKAPVVLRNSTLQYYDMMEIVEPKAASASK